MSLISSNALVSPTEASALNLKHLVCLQESHPSDFITITAHGAFEALQQERLPWYFYAAKLAVNTAEMAVPAALSYGLVQKYNYLELAGILASVYVVNLAGLIPPVSRITSLIQTLLPFESYEEEEKKTVDHYKLLMTQNLTNVYDDLAIELETKKEVNAELIQTIEKLKRLLPKIHRAIKSYGLSPLTILAKFESTVRQLEFSNLNKDLLTRLTPEQVAERMCSFQAKRLLNLSKRWIIPYTTLPLLIALGATTRYEEAKGVSAGLFLIFGVEALCQKVLKSHYLEKATVSVHQVFDELRSDLAAESAPQIKTALATRGIHLDT